MKFAPTLKFNTCSMFDHVTNVLNHQDFNNWAKWYGCHNHAALETTQSSFILINISVGQVTFEQADESRIHYLVI